MYQRMNATNAVAQYYRQLGNERSNLGSANQYCIWDEQHKLRLVSVQYSIQFNYEPGSSAPVQWNIQNNVCPATSFSDYTVTGLGIPYVVGHTYVASMSPTSSTQATFSITDATNDSSWSMTYWVPSASVVYDPDTFSPASAVEGVPYRRSPSYTNVPYFPFTVKNEQTVTSHLVVASSGFNPPTTISTYHAQTTSVGSWSWAMEGTSTTSTSSSTTSVSANPSSVTVGNTIVFTATVTGSLLGPTPTGSVAWFQGGSGGSFSPGSCQLVSGSCQATYTAPSTAGTVTISVQYSGDPKYAERTGTSTLSVAAPFDFSMSNSGGVTVTRGSSGANKVTVTLTSGSTQPVSLSCSGLPSGASCSFNPTSADPTYSSTLTITTSSSTPKGTCTITVSATGGGKSHTTQFA